MARFVLILLLTTASCRYVGRRALDFVDQFRGSVGVGTAVGVRGRAVGLVDTGLMVGIKPNAGAIGVRYGKPLFFNTRDDRYDADQAEIIRATSVRNMDWGTGSYDNARNSVALLPAVFTWADATPDEYTWTTPREGNEFETKHWIWSRETSLHNRFTQIHAFDVELELGIFLYVEMGFSFGEMVDFFLGIFGIDIAKDDGRIK